MTLYLILAFVAGMIVMDLMYAHRSGALAVTIHRIKNLFRKRQPDYTQHSED